MISIIVDSLEEAYFYFLGEWNATGNHPSSRYKGYADRTFEGLIQAKALQKVMNKVGKEIMQGYCRNDEYE